MATQNIVFLVIFIIFLAFLFISSFVAKNWVKETDDYVLAGRQISTGMNIFGVIAIGFAGTTMALAPGFAIQFGFKDPSSGVRSTASADLHFTVYFILILFAAVVLKRFLSSLKCVTMERHVPLSQSHLL